MRTWTQPQWMREQDGIAQARGFAYVKQHNGSPSFAKVIWKNTWFVQDDFGKKSMFELQVKRGGKTETFVFDSQEFAHWIGYA